MAVARSSPANTRKSPCNVVVSAALKPLTTAHGRDLRSAEEAQLVPRLKRLSQRGLSNVLDRNFYRMNNTKGDMTRVNRILQEDPPRPGSGALLTGHPSARAKSQPSVNRTRTFR